MYNIPGSVIIYLAVTYYYNIIIPGIIIQILDGGESNIQFTGLRKAIVDEATAVRVFFGTGTWYKWTNQIAQLRQVYNIIILAAPPVNITGYTYTYRRRKLF